MTLGKGRNMSENNLIRGEVDALKLANDSLLKYLSKKRSLLDSRTQALINRAYIEGFKKAWRLKGAD